MSLKPIYGKAPLTDLKALALRCGRIRTADADMIKLCGMLSSQKDNTAAWAPAFRLACAVSAHPMQEECAKWIEAAVDGQAEDGSYDDDLRSDIDKAAAVWAMYELTAEKDLIGSLMRWCAHVDARWQSMMEQAELRTCDADLLELLCDIYRVTGKKAVLKLCERARQDGMNWSGVLHTFSVQRPMKRIMSAEELLSCMENEDGSENGFYTRQYMTCRSDLLADGARSSIIKADFSGNGQEYAAAETGWKKIAKFHGAACGATTSDPTLEGNAPSAAVSALAVGAWMEAFAAQLEAGDSTWAADALDCIMSNAVPAALADGKLLRYQRVNSLGSDAGEWGCYNPSDDVLSAANVTARFARGCAAVLQCAVMTTPAGARINFMMDGRYTLRLNGETAVLTVSGGKVTVGLKNSVKAAVAVRIPAWTNDDAFISVNDEGADAVKTSSYFTIDREWQDGDVINVSFPKALRVEKGYHQSVCVYYGAQLMALPVTGDDWAYAAAGEPVEEDGRIMMNVSHVDGWKAAGPVPFDMPILPAAGESRLAELKPYAETGARIAQFPWSAAK